jgi:hypothetical protein
LVFRQLQPTFDSGDILACLGTEKHDMPYQMPSPSPQHRANSPRCCLCKPISGVSKIVADFSRRAKLGHLFDRRFDRVNALS